MDSIIQLLHTLAGLAGQILSLLLQLLIGVLNFFLAIIQSILGFLHLG